MVHTTPAGQRKVSVCATFEAMRRACLNFGFNPRFEFTPSSLLPAASQRNLLTHYLRSSHKTEPSSRPAASAGMSRNCLRLVSSLGQGCACCKMRAPHWKFKVSYSKSIVCPGTITGRGSAERCRQRSELHSDLCLSEGSGGWHLTGMCAGNQANLADVYQKPHGLTE